MPYAQQRMMIGIILERFSFCFPLLNAIHSFVCCRLYKIRTRHIFGEIDKFSRDL